ncbi:MAG: four-helix bundle copper-binding protein [Rhodobacterales bacterium 32-66-7]|nr:MAG: four-helix bundle copper-binding protein [Rhodobacterales bacterium 12-65-15]OYX24660.1 MAG: four-helix bundle copper-binding protein [Rhodobacterales bacterium 32-66-7]
MDFRAIIASHPDVKGATADRLIEATHAALHCAHACHVCADACLAEPMAQDLAQCIRLDQDCADLCLATWSLGTRRTGQNVEVLRQLIELCAKACRMCAEECERHAGMHDHCRLCADSCRKCEAACRAALAEVH